MCPHFNILPSVAVTVAVAVPAVAFDNFVMNGLDNRHWIGLHDVHRNFHDIHDWDLHDLLNRHRVLYRHVHDPFHWHFHDLFNWVWNGLVYFDCVDLYYWDWDILYDWNLDRVGLGYWYMHRLWNWDWDGLGNVYCHLSIYVVRLIAYTVLSGSSISIGQSMNFINNWSFRAWRGSFTSWTASNSSTV